MWFLEAVTFHGPKLKSCLLLLKPCDIIMDREASINCKTKISRIVQTDRTNRLIVSAFQGLWCVCLFKYDDFVVLMCCLC